MTLFFLMATSLLLASNSLASHPSAPDQPLQKRLVPEAVWWDCSSYFSTTDFARYFPVDAQNALEKGYSSIEETDFQYSHYGNRYPHYFGNYENLQFNSDCMRLEARHNLRGYPIFAGSTFSDGDIEGPDRIIFEYSSNAFCGVITHRGHHDNGFHLCTTYNGNLEYKDQFGASETFDNLPWMQGISGGSLGTNKAKRRADDYQPDIFEHLTGPRPRSKPQSTGLKPRQSQNLTADCSSTPACNAPGCSGINLLGDTSMGICQAGDCIGMACTNICSNQTQSCTADNCNGEADPTGKTGACTTGDYAGCPCTPSCTSPPVSCSSCSGFSFSNGTGICGPGDQDGCPCQSSCSTSNLCNANNCTGINDPNNGPGQCFGGDFAGCPCTSICSTMNDCNANGCNGYNNQTSSGENIPGTCTTGDYAGCSCNSVCPSNLACNDSASHCNGLNNSTGPGMCTAGEYRGCSCESSCPSSPPSCSDPFCFGQNGVCQGIENWGCQCSGEASSPSTITPEPAAATATLDCSNPSPEDGDGLCTCWVGSQTIGTYTPVGGNCPTAVPSGVSLALAAMTTSQAAAATPQPPAAATSGTFECSNPSPEDGDGLCTCSVGTSTVGTYTPTGGSCPTAAPS